MAQVVQIRRRVGGGAGRPANLQPGELAYNDAAHDLFVGDGTNTTRDLVSAARQVEIAGAQTITGVKTIAVANLRMTGGAAGEVLSAVDAAGNLDFVPMVSASQAFVGQFTGATGAVSFTGDSGATGPDLPAAGPTNDGWYIICNVAGATPPVGAGAGVVGPFDQGDWIISNGTAWTHLDFGGTAVSTASEVGVTAPLTGPSVQDELERISTDAANHVVGPAASVDDRIATFDGITGLLIQDSGTLIADLATKAYVDTENGDQDTLIAANAAAILALETNDAAQDTAIAAAGDVKGPASVTADGNIAVYNLLTGKLIKDGGTTLAAIQTLIDGKVDVVGDTMSGPLNLPAAMPTAATHAAHKAYVDQEILAVSGGASVLVTGPELVGTGLAGAEITFTGITAEANVFGGDGLSATPLTLLLVDGGTF